MERLSYEAKTMKYLGCFLTGLNNYWLCALDKQDDKSDVDVWSINETLCALIALSSDWLFNEYELAMQACEAGTYVGGWDKDIGINDCLAYFGEPTAPKGCVRISNWYSEYSFEDSDYNDTGEDQSQVFTFAQMRLAIKTWNEFRDMVKRDGIGAWQGKRYELPFPDGD
jgi:hypothetical protein